MQMLKAKLYLLKQEENAEKLSDIRGEIKDIAWGNQIRSYVLQPYKLVKDLGQIRRLQMQMAYWTAVSTPSSTHI